MDPFLGEIRLFPWSFPPRGWVLCDGSVLPVSQYAALASLLGKTYGGDGQTNFGLPDLRGRAPLHQGTDPNGTVYALGAHGGAETVALTTAGMPAHTHIVGAGSDPADKAVPGATFYLAQAHIPGQTAGSIYGPPTNLVQLAPGSIGDAGASAAHANMQPYLVLNYCIATAGIYPARP